MPEGTADAAATEADATKTGTAGAADNTDGGADLASEVEKWKTLARKHEGTAKSNATKAAEFDKLVEASKTDQQRLEERAMAAEQQLTPLQAENARLKVALAKGLPVDLVERLKGDTLEEITADADALIALLGNTNRTQVPDLRAAAGQRPNQAGGAQSADDWLRQMAGRGR